MRRGRHDYDQEGLQRVLLLGGVLLGLAGIAITAWGLAANGWGLAVGPILVVLAAACTVVSRDDGKGRWCPECVARNPESAETCANCGHALG